MSDSKLTLAAAIAAVILQAIQVWQNRKPKRKTGRHRRE